MDQERIYQIALTQIPGIGCVQAKILIEHFGTAENIFKAKKSELEKITGIGSIRAANIKNFTQFEQAEKELRFVQKHHIKLLFVTDSSYPSRLLHCYDNPTLLYYLGDADLNSDKIISIVGTRSHTDYGRWLTEKLMEELADKNITIISGLAFGIDTIAHKAALKQQLPTVGVLAHGLDMIYPAKNTKLVSEMLAAKGGILTELSSGTKPSKYQFPARNRIVAGLSDATIIIETAIKGGSMITADLAGNYNREVFAFPGRITDAKSKGCNYLIQSNKAVPLHTTQDLLEWMNWTSPQQPDSKKEKQVDITLSDTEKNLIALLQQHGSLQIDDIYIKSNLNIGDAAAILLNLELLGIVSSLPGKKYALQKHI